MPARSIINQMASRYQRIDGATGASHETATHCEPAVLVLPQYEADDGPLTSAQVRQIRKQVLQSRKQSMRSSLVDMEAG